MAEFVESTKNNKKVVVYAKSWCGYCNRVKDLLKKVLAELNMSSELFVIDIDKRNDCNEVQDYLASTTGARSVPRVFVNGKSIGGCDDTIALHKSGGLVKAIKA